MTNSSPLVSIGYEGRTAEGLVDTLLEQGVEILVDVRLTPLSRKPGLSKTKLADRLADAGIEYRHLKALGNPKDNRAPFWNGVAEEGCVVFEAMLAGVDQQVALQEVADLAERYVVAVLCVERDHDRCHRQVVTRRVGELAAQPDVVFA